MLFMYLGGSVKNFGYACINMTLQEEEKIQCNRGMIKRTFKAKGITYARLLTSVVSLTHQNLPYRTYRICIVFCTGTWLTIFISIVCPRISFLGLPSTRWKNSQTMR